MTESVEPREPGAERKRASDSARKRAADTLAAAFSDGQITMAEFDQRTAQAWAAVYADELERLTADLSPAASVARRDAPLASPDALARRSHSDALAYLTDQPGGSSFSVAVMGGTEKAGDWHIAPTHSSLAVMGGNSLDLRHAQLSARETVINAFAVMGGVEIIVPEDVRVVDDGFALMGGFGISNHRSCTMSQRDLPDEAPVFRIRGFALMGGVGIVRASRDAQL